MKKQPVKKRWNAIIEYIKKNKLPHDSAAEIGVWQGKTSMALLKALPSLNLILVDRWAVTPEKDSYFEGSKSMCHSDQKTFDTALKETVKRVQPYSNRVKIYKMHSAIAANMIPDKSLDFVFVDGDHSYIGCITDFGAWLPKIKDTGLICGHDYENKNTKQEVKRAVDNFFPEKKVFLSYDHTWFIKL